MKKETWTIIGAILIIVIAIGMQEKKEVSTSITAPVLSMCNDNLGAQCDNDPLSHCFYESVCVPSTGIYLDGSGICNGGDLDTEDSEKVLDYIGANLGTAIRIEGTDNYVFRDYQNQCRSAFVEISSDGSQVTIRHASTESCSMFFDTTTQSVDSFFGCAVTCTCSSGSCCSDGCSFDPLDTQPVGFEDGLTCLGSRVVDRNYFCSGSLSFESYLDVAVETCPIACSDGACVDEVCDNAADTNTDCSITLSEVITYANKWINNEGVTLTQVISSAQIWVSGGAY